MYRKSLFLIPFLFPLALLSAEDVRVVNTPNVNIANQPIVRATWVDAKPVVLYKDLYNPLAGNLVIYGNNDTNAEYKGLYVQDYNLFNYLSKRNDDWSIDFRDFKTHYQYLQRDGSTETAGKGDASFHTDFRGWNYDYFMMFNRYLQSWMITHVPYLAQEGSNPVDKFIPSYDNHNMIGKSPHIVNLLRSFYHDKDYNIDMFQPRIGQMADVFSQPWLRNFFWNPSSANHYDGTNDSLPSESITYAYSDEEGTESIENAVPYDSLNYYNTLTQIALHMPKSMASLNNWLKWISSQIENKDFQADLSVPELSEILTILTDINIRQENWTDDYFAHFKDAGQFWSVIKDSEAGTENQVSYVQKASDRDSNRNKNPLQYVSVPGNFYGLVKYGTEYLPDQVSSIDNWLSTFVNPTLPYEHFREFGTYDFLSLAEAKPLDAFSENINLPANLFYFLGHQFPQFAQDETYNTANLTAGFSRFYKTYTEDNFEVPSRRYRYLNEDGLRMFNNSGASTLKGFQSYVNFQNRIYQNMLQAINNTLYYLYLDVANITNLSYVVANSNTNIVDYLEMITNQIAALQITIGDMLTPITNDVASVKDLLITNMPYLVDATTNSYNTLTNILSLQSSLFLSSSPLSAFESTGDPNYKYSDFLTNFYDRVVFSSAELSDAEKPYTNWFSRIEMLLGALVLQHGAATNLTDTSEISNQSVVKETTGLIQNDILPTEKLQSLSNSLTGFSSVLDSVASFSSKFESINKPSTVLLYSIDGDTVEMSVSSVNNLVEVIRVCTSLVWLLLSLFVAYRLVVLMIQQIVNIVDFLLAIIRYIIGA